MSVEDEILKALVDGAKLSEVYSTVESYVKKEKPALLDKMTKTLGFVTGIEFRESSLVIGPKNNAVVQKGMVFNVNLGFSDLDNTDSNDDRGQKCALFLSDTVVVGEVRRIMLQLCWTIGWDCILFVVWKRQLAVNLSE